MSHPALNPPVLGYGLGLRQPHYEQVVKSRAPVDWFEVLSENFMEAHPGHWEFLTDLRAQYPVILHGVAMNIAGAGAMDRDYLAKLKALADHVRPVCVSDHLCWTGARGINSHDLLPVPYTEEALAHVADRVAQVQDALGRPLVLENPSTYTEFQASTMPEWEFMARLADKSGCGLLLDVNNVYVSAFNHRYDAKRYIDAMPANRIAYIHLAGHRNMGTHIIDTHDDHVIDGVWDLYRYTVAKFGSVATMVEWDGNIPAFDVLLAELGKARDVAQGVTRKAAS
jgi:uncharacterized protein (UPF0276 family)